MKRHLIVFYVCLIVLLLAGRIAWQHCIWELLSSVSSAAIVCAILIIGWRVIKMRPDEGDQLVLKGELLSITRMTIIVICIGILIAGFGDIFGRHMFGCR